MKKSELFFAAILVPLDYLMILFAASIAFWLRFTPGIIEIKPVLFNFSFQTYIRTIATVAPFFIIIFAFEGLYSLKSTRTFWKEFFKIIFATSVGLTIVILAIFLRREWFSSRFVILSAWLISIVLIAGSRYIVNFIQRLLLIYKGIGRHRLVLIGQNGFCDLLKKRYFESPELGYEVITSCATSDPDSLALIHKDKNINEILVCDPNHSMAELRRVSDFCHRNRIEFKFVPAILQSVGTNFEIKVLFDEPVIEIKNTPLDGWGKIAKRAFDIAGSAIGIILTSPILFLTALAIRLESPGPSIFRNERVGHKGKFNLFKFRYMDFKYCTGEQNPDHKKALEYEKKLAEKQSVRKGPVYKIKNDPRRTRIGRFIEATSIDELPQLFNVFRGDMSLVGPRPHQTREVEHYDEWQRRTLSIKPGVTGLAQISGRSDLNFSEEAKLDIYYIENWSLWLDIQIIFNTFFVLLKKRKNL